MEPLDVEEYYKNKNKKKQNKKYYEMMKVQTFVKTPKTYQSYFGCPPF